MSKKSLDHKQEERFDHRKAEVEAEAKAKAEAEDKAGGENEGDEIEAQIAAAEREAKEHYDKLLRVMADFDNYKKRQAREREELTRFSNEKLLADLLPALDDLDRVLEHVPIDASKEVRDFEDGVALARRSLASTLEKFGLKEVAALGERFDPAQHEAIATVESESEPGSVIAVHRKGYWLHDRLLRPAMVTVAKEGER
ncbi:MAG: nucleotide exchange factor GrpE [Proteobacteria bacterium]|nr:nucleotide exchange factor GrpE [Pseudomonadota bacterium]